MYKQSVRILDVWVLIFGQTDGIICKQGVRRELCGVALDLEVNTIMKTAILTFQDALNYGAVLQAYALQHTLEKTFSPDEVGVLNYHCPIIRQKHAPTYVSKKGNPVKGFLKMLRYYPLKKRRKEVFDAFKARYLNLISYDTPEEKKRFSQAFDAIVVGSDQVWNTDLTDNDAAYFLSDFSSMKRFSYAASIGKREINAQEAERYKALASLDRISVREASAKQILSTIIPNDVYTVPDPVLLLDQAEWRTVAKPYGDLKPGSYVLLYQFNTGASLVNFAKQKAAERGCKVVSIQNVDKQIPGAQVICDASPDEFVWLFDNAACVVTNSFHGTMFSVIFEKEFYSETKMNRSTRIVELLQKYQMNDSVLENGKPTGGTRDRELSRQLVAQDRQRGFDFIALMKDAEAQRTAL